jgi:excinuclease ABC subunit C
MNTSESINLLKQKVFMFPDSPGVYLFKSQNGTPLYIGKAISLKKRVLSYFNSQKSENPKITSLLSRVSDIEFILTNNENEALILESNLIKKHKPHYNIVLRDDKSYPYLKLTVNEKFPRVLVSRHVYSDGAKYYGPFPNLKIREIIKLIHRFFNIRDCNLPMDNKLERACLSYQINQCPAPCIGMITARGYHALVRRVEWFLEGKHTSLIQYLKLQMAHRSTNQEYEEAAKFRDLILVIQKMQVEYPVIVNDLVDLDVIAFIAGLNKVLVSLFQVRQGKLIDHIQLNIENELDILLPEVVPRFLNQFYIPGTFKPQKIIIASNVMHPSLNRELSSELTNIPIEVPKCAWESDILLLAEKNAMIALSEHTKQLEVLIELKNLLHLKKIPRMIACFDISTLQGTFTVGSAIVFLDGIACKNKYRKFKIKTLKDQNDYQAHQEMMKRYLNLLEKDGENFPDLFLIDGGKGQLHAVEPILRQIFKTDSRLAAIAKREEEVFVPFQNDPIDFKEHMKARYLLQRIRDESHRFAVGYHRILRDKQMLVSSLKQVPGIGPSKVNALFKTFESFDSIKNSSIEDIQKVPGFSTDLATKLYNSLHTQNQALSKKI